MAFGTLKFLRYSGKRGANGRLLCDDAFRVWRAVFDKDSTSRRAGVPDANSGDDEQPVASTHAAFVESNDMLERFKNCCVCFYFVSCVWGT